MRANIIMGIFCVSDTPEYKKPIPDPTKGDRETFRKVISEWRSLCFKYTDEIVELKSLLVAHENTIKRLKAEIKQLKTNDAKN